MPRVSIVIPNWNGMKHLEECLVALRDQTYRDFEVIVVDNASTDESISYLQTSWPDVRIIELPGNLGFPAAVNAGILGSSSPYVVLLNNDTRAMPTWLERLVGGMDARPEFTFGSSKLLRLHTPDKIDSVGHSYSIWLGAGDNVGEEQPNDRYDEPAWIFGACAAASIYRREIFDDIGVFDAEFFFTHEDVDFDLRANAAGHRGLLVADAIVYHKRGASYEISRELTLMGVRNRIWCAGKNLPPLALAVWIGGKALRVLWWVPARLAGFTPGREASRADTRFKAKGAWREVTIWSAAAAGLDALKRLPAKRRETKRARRVSSVALIRAMRATREPVPLDRERIEAPRG